MPKRPRIKNVRWHGGQYVFRAKLGDETITKALGPDAKEARRQAFLLKQDLEAKRLEGKPLPGTVAEFAQTWIEQYVRRHRTKNVEKAEKLAKARLRMYILPVLGHLRLSEVRRVHLEELATNLEREVQKNGKRLSVNTRRHILSDARCLFSYAVEMEVLEHSPFTGKRVLPEAPMQRPQPIADADLAKILELVPEPYRSAIVLAARTGMRWGGAKEPPVEARRVRPGAIPCT